MRRNFGQQRKFKTCEIIACATSINVWFRYYLVQYLVIFKLDFNLVGEI
jgi:hypothetical protein